MARPLLLMLCAHPALNCTNALLLLAGGVGVVPNGWLQGVLFLISEAPALLRVQTLAPLETNVGVMDRFVAFRVAYQPASLQRFNDNAQCFLVLLS